MNFITEKTLNKLFSARLKYIEGLYLSGLQGNNRPCLFLRISGKKQFVKKYFVPIFATAFTSNKKDDSVAQLVEHLPFKEGVLSSSLS